MALVNGGFLHYMDMKKFWKKSWNFDLSRIVALVNGGYFNYTDIKKILRNSSSLVKFWNNFTEMYL